MADESQNAEQPDQGSAVPEWVPDKFRSNPEDFGKSYTELEAKLTQTTQQLRATQDQVEQFLAQQEEQKQQQPDENFMQTSQDQLYAAYEQDPVATMAWLAQQAAQSVVAAQAKNQEPDPEFLQTQAIIAGKYAEDQVTARYPDWTDYREKVAEEIETNPDLYPEGLFTTPTGIEKALVRAYKAVKLDSLESDPTQTVEQQIAAQRLAKSQAQTLSGAAGRPEPTSTWEDKWEQIKNAPSNKYSDIAGG